TWADAIPVIDGSATDRQWADAEPLRGENLTVRSIHNDDRIAFLFEWNDPTLSLGTAGAWQLTGDGWRENRTVTKWESFVGKRHPEWLGLYWNINSPDFARQGCTATCHEGTGKHHTTPEPGEHVDTWHILSKHGWGAEFIEDQGWLLGAESVSQRGSIRFAKEEMDPRQPVSGSFTFVGYGEDGVLSNPEDTEMRADNRPAVAYCSSCHEVPDTVMGDGGAIPYERNVVEPGDKPRYVETRPQDFTDAMVLTKAEVQSGEAVDVSTLDDTAQQAAWAEYARFNATVPQLVLATPGGSASDLNVAATWQDGHWTVEVIRDLLTGSPDDVQFDDRGDKYGFAVSLWDKSDLGGDLRRYPLLLSFED
ncbi:MAG: ethylbenzene dehydrogenase-related protein, partial [Coriobacteriia bacterium]